MLRLLKGQRVVTATHGGLVNEQQRFSIHILIFALAAYILLAFPLFAMRQKIGSSNAWFAFVPILNAVLLLEIAGKELWWILLFFVPCVNIIITAIVWKGVAERMEKPGWLSVIMLVPGINFIIPYYLAFG